MLFWDLLGKIPIQSRYTRRHALDISLRAAHVLNPAPLVASVPVHLAKL